MHLQGSSASQNGQVAGNPGRTQQSLNANVPVWAALPLHPSVSDRIQADRASGAMGGTLCAPWWAQTGSCSQVGGCQERGFVAMQFPMSYVCVGGKAVRCATVRCVHMHAHCTVSLVSLGGPLWSAGACVI